MFKAHFTATNIAYMALFTALAFVVSLLEFPIFPAADFLKFDFSNVFFMIEGFIFGPVEAVFSIGIKELLCWAKSTTGGVGQLANFIVATAYVIIPSLIYRFKKGRWWVVLYLFCGCALQVAVSLPVNRYINFPFFMGAGAAGAFQAFWKYVLAFNVVKSVGVSLVVFLIYKPLSRVITLTAEKIAAKRNRARRVQEETGDDSAGEEVLENSSVPEGAVCSDLSPEKVQTPLSTDEK